jgi:hypothetical protein
VSIGALSLEIARAFSHHATPETSDFSAAFVVVGLMTLAAVPLATLMPVTAGDDLTGRQTAATATESASKPQAGD